MDGVGPRRGEIVDTSGLQARVLSVAALMEVAHGIGAGEVARLLATIVRAMRRSVKGTIRMGSVAEALVVIAVVEVTIAGGIAVIVIAPVIVGFTVIATIREANEETIRPGDTNIVLVDDGVDRTLTGAIMNGGGGRRAGVVAAGFARAA